MDVSPHTPGSPYCECARCVRRHRLTALAMSLPGEDERVIRDLRDLVDDQEDELRMLRWGLETLGGLLSASEQRVAALDRAVHAEQQRNQSLHARLSTPMPLRLDKTRIGACTKSSDGVHSWTPMPRTVTLPGGEAAHELCASCGVLHFESQTEMAVKAPQGAEEAPAFLWDEDAE